MQNLVPATPFHASRRIVLARDDYCCVSCGEPCGKGEADVHHLIPRSLGGTDEPSNLVTLCDGCHGAHHPNLHATLARGFIERWALRLARWLDRDGHLPRDTEQIGTALRIFGFERFRDNQLDVVLAALRGESVLFVSPTGSGKTLCFLIPGILRKEVTYVISPLKALMSDQISNLHRKKIPSSFINSDLGPEEKELRYRLLESHALKFLYCTPERFSDSLVRQEEVKRIAKQRPSFLVVDEAHCVDKWGDDFRPSYSQLGQVKKILGNPPILAFTATAGVVSQKRIMQSLEIPDARVIVSGVDRPNITLIRLKIKDEKQKLGAIYKLLACVSVGKTMIFVPTIKIGQQLQANLASLGAEVPFYHANCGTANDRDMLLGRFTGRIQPEIRTIICTNAFGMGIDVRDVRMVIHWQHPPTMEDYLQEFGRAGRDDKQSVAILFTANSDIGLLQYMAKKTAANMDGSPERKNAVLTRKLSHIEEMSRLVNRQNNCFRSLILNYFIEDRSKPKLWLLSMKIIEWLFSTNKRRRNFKWCCDNCNHITNKNYDKQIEQILK